MRKPVGMVVVALVLGIDAGAQDDPEVLWLREHALPLQLGRGAQDFADLEPLRDILAGVQVVQLGEQSHGDGTVFDTKVRLIQFLHQELGFDVLAFESGLYDCRKAWQAFQSGMDPWEAARQGVFAVWTESAQLQPLFEYLASQALGEQPLELAGFDCQFTARASSESLMEDLRAAVQGVEPLILQQDAWLGFERGLTAMLEDEAVPAGEQALFHSGAQELAELFQASEPRDSMTRRDLDYWRQLVRSIQGYARVRWEVRDDTGLAEQFNPRDAQMGENLVWLARSYYSGRKIIVWAATMHCARNVDTIDTRSRGFSYAGVLPMGHYLHEALAERSYTVGFIAQEGRAGNALQGKPSALEPAPAGSFESLCAAAGLECAWIDLRNTAAWLREPRVARPLGYAPMTADWTRIVDGFIFHRTMEPSRRRFPDQEVEERRDLLVTLEKTSLRYREREEQGNPFAFKGDFGYEWDTYCAMFSPSPKEALELEQRVERWRFQSEDDPGVEWRAQSLLSRMAQERGALDLAEQRIDAALAAYPDHELPDPSVHSGFQHLVNQKAQVLFESKGFEAALDCAAELLETDARFDYFHPTPWEEFLPEQAMPELRRRIQAAYERRKGRFPEDAARIDEYASR